MRAKRIGWGGLRKDGRRGEDSRAGVGVARRATGKVWRDGGGWVTGKERTHVDGCLDARFRPGALEYDIKPACRLVEARAREDAVRDGLCAVHVVLEGELVGGGPRRGWCLWWFRSCSGRRGRKRGGGRVDNVVDEARADGELEARLVDVDADDAGGALGAGEGAGEEADGAGAEDEDGRVGGEGRAPGGVEDDAEGLCEGGLLVGDALGKGVEPLVGVVHVRLEGPVEMGGGLGRGAEAHVGAEVVSALLASCTSVQVVAGDAALDGDAGADLEVGWRVRPEGGDYTSCFMA